MSSVSYDYVKFSQSVTNRIPNVDVTIEADCLRGDNFGCNRDSSYKNWTMRLQRREYSPSTGQPYWATIGTRTGYVHVSSKSNRQFTSVGNRGDIRVQTQLTASAYHGAGTLTDRVR